MDLKYEFYIGGKPVYVWNALVSPTETKKIYYGSEIQSNFEVGSPLKYVEPGKDGQETIYIHEKVLEFQPNKTFMHTYIIGDSYAVRHSKFKSRISYELEPFGVCTKLTVTHDQWTKGDPSYENTAKGWRKLLCVLKTLIETGKPLDLSVHYYYTSI